MAFTKSTQDQMNSDRRGLPCRFVYNHRSKAGLHRFQKEAVKKSPTVVHSSEVISAEKFKPRLESTMPEPNPHDQQTSYSGCQIVDYDTLLATIQNMPTESYPSSSVAKERLTNGGKESTVGSKSLINTDPVEATSNGDIFYNATLISSDTSGEIPKDSAMDEKSLIENPHSASPHCAHGQFDQFDSQATYLPKDVEDSQSVEQAAAKFSHLQADMAEMRSMMENLNTRLSLVQTKQSKLELAEATNAYNLVSRIQNSQIFSKNQEIAKIKNRLGEVHPGFPRTTSILYSLAGFELMHLLIYYNFPFNSRFIELREVRVAFMEHVGLTNFIQGEILHRLYTLREDDVERKEKK